MKWLKAALFCGLASVASASTIAVTGGGVLNGEFFVSGDNFFAGSGKAGDSLYFGYCALGAPCNITSGASGHSPSGSARFNGQTSEGIEGGLSIEGFVNIPANPKLQESLTAPVSVGGDLTAVFIPGLAPFFRASVHGTGTATLVTDFVVPDCSHFGISGPCAFMINPIFQFSGTAEVNLVSGSEVPEPSTLLLVAGALAFGIIWRGRRPPAGAAPERRVIRRSLLRFRFI